MNIELKLNNTKNINEVVDLLKNLFLRFVVLITKMIKLYLVSGLKIKQKKI